jgi:hypothetical protein
MTKQDDTPRRRGRGIAAWIAALLATVASLAYQDRTGPTYPLQGSITTQAGTVRFICMRSQTIGSGLAIVLNDPVPEGVTAAVRYRRLLSRDPWTTLPMARGTFAIAGRGRSRSVSGLGAVLPSLRERAGKYEYFLELTSGSGAPISVTGTRPIYARYKAAVPGWALAAHILAIFVSMLFAIRTTLAALLGEGYARLLLATVVTLIIGGFVLGPLVQWYAFGVWWAGYPYGYDWTDNKVVVELAFWLAALWMNRRGQRRAWIVVLAGIATLAVYFVPHSIFGSEYNYITGQGHGTAG